MIYLPSWDQIGGISKIFNSNISINKVYFYYKICKELEEKRIDAFAKTLNLKSMRFNP